jgi:hypothetical protein
MKHTLWASIIQWALWGIAMSLLMRGGAKCRTAPCQLSHASKLYPPRGILIIGTVNCLFFFGIAIISNVYPNPTVTIYTTTFVLFGLFSIVLFAGYIFDRHEITELGIRYGSMLGRRGFIAWSDILRVRYGRTLNWFVLESANGEIARLSILLIGLPEFAKAVLAHVDKTVSTRC